MKRLYEAEMLGHKRQALEQQVLFSCYQQLSEHDILQIQDIFLTNGVHRITSYDLFTGRTLVDIFLQAMAHHYHEKACLTMHARSLDVSTVDLYTLVQLFTSAPHEDLIEYFEEFFTEEFSADFLWIEETVQLRSQPWYQLFLDMLVSLQLDRSLPVIIFSYEAQEQ